MQSSGSRDSLWGLPLLIIAGAAVCVVLPFFWLGIPSGHDFEFHLNSWIEVVDHWKQGVIYPHWAALAHNAYGEARFVFYPPLSWTLGAALGLILPWKLVPGAYIWMALTLAGSSMFLLSRRWLSRTDAVFAAVVYAANPYHLVIVYWRSAMAELLASAFIPLLLLFVLRLAEEGPPIIAPLSLLMGAGWLTNIPGAVMMNYSLALLVICVAISKRSYAVVAYGAAAAVLGAGVAAIYLVPVFHQQSWVNLGQVLAPGVRPQESFLFTTTTDPDHNRFNLLVSVVAVWQMAIVATAIFVSRKMRKWQLWPLLCAWSGVCTLLMFRFTLPLWMRLPELRYVQFPWRWLLCLNVPFAMAIVLALRRWWLRGLVYAVALAGVLLVWRDVQPPWWDKSGDIQEMVDNQHDWIGDEGADEYVPAGIDPYDADQNAPRVRFEGVGRAQIQIKKWDAESRSFSADASAPGKLVLRQFNYPSWQVRVNGKSVKTETTDPAGEMVVPISRRDSRVEVSFVEGWDRWAGAGISLLSLLGGYSMKRRSMQMVA